mmetsp:Transcript_25351/g.38431  ORF Transcript_25351/g.38431 Transcript_25351/m.38431 type:complete len:175 (+) Transcript_25351:1456-1980(+)
MSGDDITEIQTSVKRALQNCCQQLRIHLTKKHALRDIKERRSRLVKYIPDVSRSLFEVLDAMKKRRRNTQSTSNLISSPTKRLRVNNDSATNIIKKIQSHELTEESIKKCLLKTVETQSAGIEDGADHSKSTKQKSGKHVQPLFLVPTYYCDSGDDDVTHPLFVFRPLGRVTTS